MLDAVPRGDRQAQRHRPGHRADRLRQDDHALLGAQRAERRSTTRSSPPRTRSSTTSTASSRCRSTHEIGMTFAAAPAGHPAAGPGQDPGRRDPRPGNGRRSPCRPSLTGHMVFSTLHTNDAPSTITRLRDMGVEPFLITATVEGDPGPAAGAQDLRGLPHRVRAVGRDADGAEPDAGRRAGQEVLLRPRLRPLQQHRLQGPHGPVRADDHERRPARHDHRSGASTDELRDACPQQRHGRRCARRACKRSSTA